MIRDHVQGTRAVVFDAEHIGRGLDQLGKQVNLVVAVHALHDRRNALETHAGIDRGLRQRCQRPIGRPVELHEDKIPDFDVAITVLIGRTWRTTRDILTMIEEDLAARTTGTRVAHRPEIVFCSKSPKARRVNLHFLEPDVSGFVVVLENRHPEAFLGQSQGLRQELPGIPDRFALEVITETEIAEHLEERVMPRGIAHILKVVVLPARTHAALRGDSCGVIALVLAEEHILELHHAGVCE